MEGTIRMMDVDIRNDERRQKRLRAAYIEEAIIASDEAWDKIDKFDKISNVIIGLVAVPSCIMTGIITFGRTYEGFLMLIGIVLLNAFVYTMLKCKRNELMLKVNDAEFEVERRMANADKIIFS